MYLYSRLATSIVACFHCSNDSTDGEVEVSNVGKYCTQLPNLSAKSLYESHIYGSLSIKSYDNVALNEN